MLSLSSNLLSTIQMNIIEGLDSQELNNSLSNTSKLSTSSFTKQRLSSSLPSKNNEQQYKNKVKKFLQRRNQIMNPMMELFNQQDGPIKITHGKGMYLFQENGKKIMDLNSNVSHIGHCHPVFISRMQKQLQKHLTNNRFLFDSLNDVTQKFLKKFPSQLCNVSYVNSGSQANDLAIQMALIHSKKRKVITLRNAYHGITKLCMDVSPYKWKTPQDQPDYIIVADPPSSYRGNLRYSKDPAKDYLAYIQSLVDEDTGVIIWELMQSCGGQLVPPQNIYIEIFKMLKRKGVCIIVDEIQTGFGRIGSHYWTFQYYGVVPDIVSTGKPMGNGYPVSAVICTQAIIDSFKKEGKSWFSTFGGGSLSATALQCVLDVVDNQKLQQNAWQTGNYLRDSLAAMIPNYSFLGDVRGRGLFIGIDFVKDKQTRQQHTDLCLRACRIIRTKGVLMNRDGPKQNVIKMKPPMVLFRQHADQLLGKFKETFDELAKQQSQRLKPKM